MNKSQALSERVDRFIEHGARTDELYQLLRECIVDPSLDTLLCVKRLYEDMYDGFTMNMMLKGPAASALLVWGNIGLQALVEGAQRQPTSKNISLTINLLASLAAGDGLPMLAEPQDDLVKEAITVARASMPDLGSVARSHLIEFFLSIPDEDDATSYVASAMSRGSMTSSAVRRELFAALSKRLLAVSTPVLQAFEALIRDVPNSEPEFQAYLTQHPQILDPLAIRIWPQPDLFGFKEPDYVVQRADGTYMVVEIECPAKTLVTRAGQLSAEVTHAEKQATDYRGYMIRRFSEFEKHFPGLQEPDCLVVVGLERDLTADQKQALHDANNSRVRVRIVGFDWLLSRARTLASNMVQPTAQILPLRVT